MLMSCNLPAASAQVLHFHLQLQESHHHADNSPMLDCDLGHWSFKRKFLSTMAPYKGMLAYSYVEPMLTHQDVPPRSPPLLPR